MLSIVPTPIGNLKDLTLRSLEALQNCDGIICEDTRRTSLLLNHYQIKKPLIILNDYNESRVFPQIINQLQSDQNLVLVSDAGTPLISDPGYKLVRECLNLEIKVDSLPGPSAPITALTLSGFPPDKFMFLGYIPEKPGARLKLYQNLKIIHQQTPTTFIAFIAPFKLIKVLEELNSELGDINICLARELTKIHQQVETKKVAEHLNDYGKKVPKGEFVLLIRL